MHPNNRMSIQLIWNITIIAELTKAGMLVLDLSNIVLAKILLTLIVIVLCTINFRHGT